MITDRRRQWSLRRRVGVVVLLLAAFGCGLRDGDRVCARGSCVRVVVAVTAAEKAKGLQGVSALPRDQGMLFAFATPARHAFWMKDTLIPLDMIWIDGRRRIVAVTADVPPCRADPCPIYRPPVPVLYVLEVNAGEAARRGWRSGDRLDFHLPDL